MYDIFVPFTVAAGSGSFTGTAQDAFGFNIQVVPISITMAASNNVQGSSRTRVNPARISVYDPENQEPDNGE